jgi:hypothetical protein
MTRKAEHIALSNKLLRQLRSPKLHGWLFIIIFDRSWFCLASPDEQPPDRPRHAIQDSTMMLTIGCNPLGFHMLDALSKSRPFNAECYRNNILGALFLLRPHVDERKFIIHRDNAQRHRVQNCRAF